jgi:hypothetical protein
LGVFDGISVHNGAVLGTLTISAVHEPSAIFLLGIGLLALVGLTLLRSMLEPFSAVFQNLASPELRPASIRHYRPSARGGAFQSQSFYTAGHRQHIYPLVLQIRHDHARPNCKWFSVAGLLPVPWKKRFLCSDWDPVSKNFLNLSRRFVCGPQKVGQLATYLTRSESPPTGGLVPFQLP